MTQLKSLVKSNELLKLFITEKKPLKIKDIINKLNYSQSTIYRIVKLLVEDNFLEPIGKGYYQPGWIIEELANSVNKTDDYLLNIAKIYLKQINEKYGETVILTKIKGNKIFVIDHIESHYNLRFSFEKGEILPAIYGASSKVLLAFSDENFKYFALKQLTQKEKDNIEKQLVKVQNSKEIVTYGEVDKGAVGIAVPIFLEKRLIGGISIAAPQFRMNETLVEKLLLELHRYSNEISFHLKNH